MSFDTILKINNETVVDSFSPIRITEEYPTLKWEFDATDRISVDVNQGIATGQGEYSQSIYEIRISTSSFNLGNDLFTGNMVQTGLVNSQELFWRYSGRSLDRGITYYGQVAVIDEANKNSGWKAFSFYYNSLPYVSNISISPNVPSVVDDLQLNYDFFDDDGDLESGSKIRWFKNGIYQRFFDNSTTILSSYLQSNDIWNADIYPSDGYEFGVRATSIYVQVSKTAVTMSDLKILPSYPNENDILKADYVASDAKEQENVSIRWYINDVLISSLNDEKYIKPSVQESDIIRFEVKNENSGKYVSSADVEIVSSKFIVKNIIIDGSVEPLDVSSISPLVQWKNYIPTGKEINYISIKIGTFYESDNIYSTTLSYNANSFTIPHDLLENGRDYYVSISASDTTSFDNYSSSHFRIAGSRWERDVSNSTGWTLETIFVAEDDGEDIDYHVMRINDGSKFAEIRIYKTKISLISLSEIEYSYSNSNSNVLTVAGKNDDIKIYLNKKLVIDGEGIFTQTSNIKRLELGAYSSKNFTIKYKYFFYTTSGYFLPGTSTEYLNLQFHTFMEFEDNEIVALRGYVGGKYIFGVNPDNTSESSSIYALKGGEDIYSSTVPRTFSPINDINKSPDGNITVCAHSKGVSVIKGYVIDNFNNELIFYNNNAAKDNWPNDNKWELVKTIRTAANYFNDEGFNINTL